jgi:NAD(P)-dependent dehydrogenase (short-subunit alcohol dehydrogenase family)
MAGALQYRRQRSTPVPLGQSGFFAERIHATPLRRIGDPLDVAGAAMFPTSPASAFMTGQVLVIDGGVTV